MGKSSQRKGRDAERELSALLNGYGHSTRPGKPVSFGTEPDIVGLPGVHIEVKRREQTDLSAALRQAQEDAAFFRDGLPAVFHRGNRQAWRVTMLLTDWMQLYGGGEADGSEQRGKQAEGQTFSEGRERESGRQTEGDRRGEGR